MEINEVLKGLDDLFRNYRISEVKAYLLKNMEEARNEGDGHSFITLLNEMIGYLRDTSQYEELIRYCDILEKEVASQQLIGSVAHATTLLNIGNAFRAAGLLKESMERYQAVFPIYDKNLAKNDFRYASLYNNLSLLYQEMKEFQSACTCLENALNIVKGYPQARIELAITYTNLAVSQMKLEKNNEAEHNLKKAFEIFLQDEEKDYHYSAALSAMGEIQYKKSAFEQAVSYYEEALKEIEKHVGRTQAYEIVSRNLKKAKDKQEESQRRIQENEEKKSELILTECEEESDKPKLTSGMALARLFYDTYHTELLKGFEAYEQYMAFGLVGDGSECLGFDDELSKDHDYGAGFCVFLPRKIYNEIGEELAKAYDKLPKTFMGVERIETKAGKGRVGVKCMEDYYKEYIGCEDVPRTEQEWLFAKPERFLSATSGQVFKDQYGEFTRIRNGLKQFYPENIRLKLLAQQLTMMAQTGQYNYKRMLKRGEKVTTQMILYHYMEHTMNTVYLLNRRFAPFYKWKHKGMDTLSILPEIMDILNAIADMEYGDERIEQIIEIIARLIVEELKAQKLSDLDELYLEIQAGEVMKKAKKSELVEKIVKLEWEAFDKVQNEGGRAGCQDDYITFSIMRKSQYVTWPEELLRSYITDFEVANDNGSNMITNKYGYMMESTTPEEFAKIKDKLPPISQEKRTLIDEIVRLQVGFMEEFAKNYPLAAANARSIHASEDTPFNTSYETYLRGELMTYSDETLVLYGRFIAKKASDGENLAKEIMNHTAVFYGYESVDDLELKLKK